MIYREYTECYSISFLFLFFFSPVIPISYQNICKMFLFTSGLKTVRAKGGFVNIHVVRATAQALIVSNPALTQ